MIPRRLSRSYGLLVIVILLFTVSIGFSYRNLLKQEGASQMQLTHVLWAATQLEIEHLRFLGALDRYVAAGGDAERTVLLRRLDMLWSRPPILLEGDGGHSFRAIEGNERFVRDYQDLLRELEPAILGLDPSDRKGYRDIRRRFAEVSLPLHNAVRATFHATDKATVFRNGDLRETYLMLAASLLGVLLNGGVLIILLVRGVQRANSAEALALKARYQAEAASRAKGDFLASMSHELRTPLNAIIGFAEVIRRQAFGPIENARYREYIEDIHRSGRHLLGVIGDILDTAKIEAGKLELDEEAVDLSETLDAVLRIVRPHATESQVSLRKVMPPNFPQIRGDRHLIQQMILNLVTNAVKFTPAEGSVHIEVELGRDGRPRLCVRDTGFGMTQTEIETALSPYGQVDPATKQAKAGTGLGLPLVRSFAELHGAELLITSVPGEGTIAVIAFPAERIAARWAAA